MVASRQIDMRQGLGFVCGTLGGAGGGGGGNWYDPVTAIIGDEGMFVAAGVGIAEAVGFGVSAWADVRGGPALIQDGVTSLRPTNQGSYVGFDGIDDRQRFANPAMFNDAHTIIVGFDAPAVDTVVRSLLCASNASSTSFLRQVHVNYGGAPEPNATRQRYYVADAGGASNIQLVDLSPIGVGPYNVVLRCGAAPAGAMAADRLESPLVSSGLDTTGPATSETKTQAEVGCRVLGAGPSRSQFWSGRIRYLIVAPMALSDGQLAIIHNTLSDRGLL